MSAWHAVRRLPAQVWRLMFAYALMMAGGSLMVLIAGIIGTTFAPSPSLATLPVALVVVGVACAALPTGRLLGRYGRRRVFIAYAVLAIVAALAAARSLVEGSFTAFCGAAFLVGWSGAAGHQYRFAAIESVAPERAHVATSVLLLGGILAAFVGPEIAVAGRGLLRTEFAGSYLLLAGAYAVGLVIVAGTRDQAATVPDSTEPRRELREILRSPVLRMAIAASAIGYGVMSYLMTATPISMHSHAGHSLEATKFVIQSHIAGMYLPSLVFPWLFARLGGHRGMMWAGWGCFAVCLAVALQDTSFLHYWLALVLLGVGWNFLFAAGTSLLPGGYRPDERFRVQSVNDFLVFSTQAVASLASGWLLALWGWNAVVWTCVPLLLVFAVHLARTAAFRTAGAAV